MDKASKIFVAGHTGIVGSAIVRQLRVGGYKNLLIQTHQDLNLLDQLQVRNFFDRERPDCVIDCAARVGGIQANISHPSEFLFENTQIQNNLIWSAFTYDVKKFLFVACSCMYPRECMQPMNESSLMTGPVEATNEGSAIAKIAGLKLCESIAREYGRDFFSCVPTNTYGPNDTFDLTSSHVIPAMFMKFENAVQQQLPDVTLWGTGSAQREFIYVDDLADACIFLLEQFVPPRSGPQFLNIGTGIGVSIKELSALIAKITGFSGTIIWDATKPDGMPRKLLDVSRLHSAGWYHKTTLEDGLRRTYDWYVQSKGRLA